MPDLDSLHRIRVCMVTPSYYPIVGGMETQIERLLPHLRNHGVDAWVLTRRTTATSAREVRNGTHVYRARILGGPGLKSISFTVAGTIRVLQQRRNVDILHAHGIMSPTTLASAAGLLLRIPTVTTLHAAYELEHMLTKPAGATRLRVFRHSVARFISISDDITALLGSHGMPSVRIREISNGIDTQAFTPVDECEKMTLRERLNLPPDTPLVVFVGRLHGVKQVDVLLAAWQQLSGGLLLVLGDGDERQALEALSRQLNISDRVRFLGMVSNVADYLRVATTFVLPSSSEGLSVALLEAMASGTVPVVTAVGGARDLLADGHNGLLVSPGDADELARALNYVIEHPEWAESASHLARQTVVERYDLNEVARLLANLYREVVTSA
jgi:glycosyltransferase involved in cell wall biosynthesis